MNHLWLCVSEQAPRGKRYKPISIYKTFCLPLSFKGHVVVWPCLIGPILCILLFRNCCCCNCSNCFHIVCELSLRFWNVEFQEWNWYGICFFLFFGHPILWNYQSSAFNLGFFFCMVKFICSSIAQVSKRKYCQFSCRTWRTEHFLWSLIDNEKKTHGYI